MEFPSEISVLAKYLSLNVKVHKNEFQQRHWDQLNIRPYRNYHVSSFM